MVSHFLTVSVCDLGVSIDKKLTFNYHMDTIIKSSLKTLGFIIRSTELFSNTSSRTILFNSLVKSRLLYASLLWFPNYAIHISRLESVQRKFYKYVSFKIDGVYPERGFSQQLLLSRFNTLSLHQSTVCASLVFLFKICNNQINSSELLSSLNFLVPYIHTRRHNVFYLNTYGTNLAMKEPLNRACNWFKNIQLRFDVGLFGMSLGSYKSLLSEKVKLLVT